MKTDDAIMAIGVLALLLCLRRRRPGTEPVDPDAARAADEAFRMFEDSTP